MFLLRVLFVCMCENTVEASRKVLFVLSLTTGPPVNSHVLFTFQNVEDDILLPSAALCVSIILIFRVQGHCSEEPLAADLRDLKGQIIHKALRFASPGLSGQQM